MERARLARPAFVLTAQHAASVVQICQRLDGIPLVLELAAARVKALSAEQIAIRLADRFRLLTGSLRTAVRRQQTLHASIDWSCCPAEGRAMSVRREGGVRVWALCHLWSPLVTAIIGAVDETFIWALFDRAPLDRWSVGRVTLLGDACHAMLPFMAQGAAQSIEDGATLAACLLQDGAADVASALRRYEALRRPRAARLQEMSRANKTRFHFPTDPSSRGATPSWPRGATEGSLRSAGSTGTTLR